MSWGKLSITGVLLLSFAAACQTVREENRADNWAQRMKNVGDAVSQLAPYVFDRQQFHDSKNRKVISDLIHQMDSTTHKLDGEGVQKMLGEDPLLEQSARYLQDDLRLAKNAFKQGHDEYSRTVLRSSLNYCFRCHTRDDYGPEFKNWTFDFTKIKMSPAAKAQLFIATRQFDKAVQELDGVLSSHGSLYEDPFEQERALKSFVSLMVRVKKDPSRANLTLDKFLTKTNIPLYLAETVTDWKKSLQDWSSLKKTEPVATVKQAKDLIKKARQLQLYKNFESGNIEYLRATAILHEALRQAKRPSDRAEIYSLLGDSYETLSSSGFWEVPEIYYEACVRQSPKTQVAKECYKSYERHVIIGYSGSGGIFIPPEERARLDELKEKAGLGENKKL